jgi:fused-like protein
MEKFVVLDLIGEGSFGKVGDSKLCCSYPKVFKGRRKHTLEIVALKFIPKSGKSPKELRVLNREIEIMRELVHPNIIRMLDTFETVAQVSLQSPVSH